MWSNDYCQYKFSNIQSREYPYTKNQSYTDTTNIYGVKDYEIKCVMVIQSPLMRWSKGSMLGEDLR